MSERLERNNEINELYERFSSSEYGKQLEKCSRFNDFKPEWMSPASWSRLLGDDVNNLRHMEHTYKIANKFCDVNDISYNNREKLSLTAITHDWGEAIIGDISVVTKTADDEKAEQIAYRIIANELYGEPRGDMISDTVWDVLANKDETGDMFHAIEYIGYCTTAMRAGYMANAISHGLVTYSVSRVKQTQLIGGLLSMEKSLQVHSYPVLKEYAQKYHGIQQMILEGV